jgi:hypothetical protein
MFKGINRDRAGKKWVARIRAGSIICYIGTFATEIEAAKAYDKKAVELHGEFACLNFPPNQQKRGGASRPKLSSRAKRSEAEGSAG